MTRGSMDIADLLKIGQHLDCDLASEGGGEIRYPCKVAHLEPDRVLLTILSEPSNAPAILPERNLTLQVIKGQALYSVRAQAISFEYPFLAIRPEGSPELIQKRSYVRVEDSFSVRFRILDPQEYERRRYEFASRTSKRGEARSLLATDWSREIQENLGEEAAAGLESLLIKMLIGLDRKLDKVIELLEHPEGETGYFKGTGVNISGAGFYFVTESLLQVGAMLEVALELSIFPGLHLMALGRTLRVREMLDFPDTHRHFEVAVEFTDIHEDDRDEVIRYTFRRQREILRTQRLNNTDLEATGSTHQQQDLP